MTTARWLLLSLVCLAVVCWPASPARAAGFTIRVSVASDGMQGNDRSYAVDEAPCHREDKVSDSAQGTDGCPPIRPCLSGKTAAPSRRKCGAGRVRWRGCDVGY